MRQIGWAVVLVAAFAVAPDARGGEADSKRGGVVGVAPVVPKRGAGDGWVAEAVTLGLVPRLMSMGFATTTMRQVEAARKQTDLSYGQLDELANAAKLGKQLGASTLVVVQAEGAAGREDGVRLHAAIVDTRGGQLTPTGKVKARKSIEGSREDLSRMVEEVAEAVAESLGGGRTKTAGTQPVPARPAEAWERLVSAERLLREQSLSPRSADPNVPLEISSNDVAEVLAHVERIVHQAPNDAEAAALLALAQELSSAPDKADASLSRARDLGGAHHPTYVMSHAFIAMRRGQFDKAEALLEEAVREQPGFLHARGSLGHLLNHFGRFREALAVFKSYTELVPEQPWVLSQLGYTEAKLGRHKDAIAHTLAAIKVQPQSAYLYVELASRYIDARDLDQALAAAAHAVALRPDYARAHVRKCFVSLLREQDSQAVNACEMAVRLRGATRRDLAYAYLNLARAYGHLGRKEQSINALSRAVALGVPTLIAVEEDPKLAALRQSPEFLEAMSR